MFEGLNRITSNDNDDFYSISIAHVRLHNREGLGCKKLHYTGGELGPDTLQILCGLHEVYSHIMASDLFTIGLIYHGGCTTESLKVFESV